MKPSQKRGTIRELEPDIQKEVRKAMRQGCSLQAKGRSKHSKLELPNGRLVSIPASVKLFRHCLARHGVLL
jgi:hypothetical protein